MAAVMPTVLEPLGGVGGIGGWGGGSGRWRALGKELVMKKSQSGEQEYWCSLARV